MRHVFRLNVFGKGYTLLVQAESGYYEELRLGVHSDALPGNYLPAQERIDSILETQVSRWHFCASRALPLSRPVLAYGCLLSMEDDKGRKGISFIHAVEIDSMSAAESVLQVICQKLLPENMGEIAWSIGGLAKGGC